MTFQPPPPPPAGPPPGGPPPPPPPPGQPPAGPSGPGWGTPAHRSSGGFDPKAVTPMDWGILAAGVLAFIFSFVSYYTYSAGGISISENAWHGFFGWFAMLLALLGSAAVATELFAPQVKLAFPNRLIGLGLYALAVLFMILAGLIDARSVPAGISSGRGAGFWLSLIVILAGAVLSFLRLQQTGATLPGPLAKIPNVGARGRQGGIGGSSGTGSTSAPPPAQSGYNQPPAGGYNQPPSGGYDQPPTGGYTQPPAGGYNPPPPPPPQ